MTYVFLDISPQVNSKEIILRIIPTKKRLQETVLVFKFKLF